MSNEELVKQRKELSAKLAELMVKRYTKQSKNSREGRNLRLKLAIINTVLQEKLTHHE